MVSSGERRMLAQGLVEYAALSSLAAEFQRTAVRVEGYVREVDPRLFAVALVVLVYLFFKRR